MYKLMIAVSAIALSASMAQAEHQQTPTMHSD